MEGPGIGTLEYKDTGTSILTSVEDIEQVLDDQIVRSQAMRGSRYNKPLKAPHKVEKMLHLLEDIIANWLKVRTYVSRTIFSSPDQEADASRGEKISTATRYGAKPCKCHR